MKEENNIGEHKLVKYWFTADTHFGHSNILKYCERPFKNINEHDYKLIRNWNSRVDVDDIVFFLGDFCFKNVKGKKAVDYIRQLKGKIIFVKGNHDVNNGVKTCIEDIRIRLGGKELLLVHSPSTAGYTFVDLVLCGHVHQHWKFKRFILHAEEKVYAEIDFCNVGVDVWNYRPISINEILREYKKWKRHWRIKK